MSNRVRILVSAWGLPRNWKHAIYSVEDSDVKDLESRTTLSPLVQALNPDFIIIFVPDTVYLERVNMRRVDNYDDLCREVREYYIEFCKNNGINLEKLYIEVCPGVGRFSIKTRERTTLILEALGSAYDYYAYLYYSLVRYIKDVLIGKNNINIFDRDLDLEFIVDLSHGVNYMPVFVYKAVRELCQLLATFRKGQVRLRTYNSDPVLEDGQEATIHLVEEVNYFRPYVPPLILEDRSSVSRVITGTRGLKDVPEYSKICKEIHEELKNLFKELDSEIVKFFKGYHINAIKLINMIIGAFYHGLPLIVSTYYVDADVLFNFLQKLFDIWRRRIMVKVENSNVKIVRFARFALNRVEVILRAALFLLGIKCLDLVPERRGVLSLKLLQDYDEKIISELNPFLGVEYGRLFRDDNMSRILNLVRGGAMLLACVRAGEEDSEDRARCVEICEEDIRRCSSTGSEDISNVCRNFIAHAGLEWCFVEIFSENDDILLKYSDRVPFECLYRCTTYMLREV
ncbi:MAG: TIGR01897 family CRISPR-associated protein [Crenarchaeota archaeon]|nr:TIGR01897 family CRISPR-associated protein [Thermoproteota archaeon]